MIKSDFFIYSDLTARQAGVNKLFDYTLYKDYFRTWRKLFLLVARMVNFLQAFHISILKQIEWPKFNVIDIKPRANTP